MKATKENLAVSVLALAVQGALSAMLAMPLAASAEGDEDVASLTHPTNFVEIGVANTSNGSDKYGEYTGLRKSGADLIGNFSVRGGDAYGMGEGTMRWGVMGTDLGTTSRVIGGTVGDQGRWNLGIKYDELRHSITESMHTPEQGAMGGNAFSIPAAFGTVRNQNPATGAQYGAQVLIPGQQTSYLQGDPQDVHSDRKNTTFTAGFNFDRQWNAQFEFNHLAQSGAKLLSAGTDANNGLGGKFAGPGGVGSYYAQGVIMLMNPTNYKTDNFTLSLNWVGDKGHFTGSYFGSRFHDEFNGLSFANPFISGAAALPQGTAATAANPFPINTMSTAPSNEFHQLNLSGGYALTQTTKLTAGYSYGRNTQNESYVNDPLQMQAGGLPQSSLNGLVVNTHADVKLTDQTTKDLMLIAGFKFNERDNRTAANTYKFYDIGGGAETSVSIPMSNKKTQFELAGDYRIDRRQNIRLSYEYEKIDRWCDSSLSNNARGAGPGGAGGIAAYYTTASCVEVPDSKENKLLGNYRLKATEDVSVTAGLAYAKRQADVNSGFYNPMQASNQGYELPAYRAFFDASRTEQLAKAGVNWQASEKLNVTLGGRYTHDNYDDSTLGVQEGHSWSANLDGTYSLAEKSTVSAYLSVQKRQRDLLNGVWSHATATFFPPPAQTWLNTLDDNDTTFGLTVKQGDLMGGKLNLVGDLTYSVGKSTYSTSLNYTAAACTLSAPQTGGQVCGTLPDISSKLLQFKLTGDYALDKASKIVMGYIYQRLNSDDYYYNAYQMGYTATAMLPTNQQNPSYSASTLFAAYNYSFR